MKFEVSQEVSLFILLIHAVGHPERQPFAIMRSGLRKIRRKSPRSKIKVGFESAAFERLSYDYELTIFRIVQESLTNINRHSGSKTAKIHLSQNDGFVHCEISDEGKGIPQEKQLAFASSTTMGVGLRGKREGESAGRCFGN